MPTTLVRTNSPGSWMLRSTWDSAAKWTTTSGRKSPKIRATLSASATSATSREKFLARLDVAQAERVAGVGQLVEAKERVLRVARDERVEEVRADEARAAGDENPHCGLQRRLDGVERDAACERVESMEIVLLGSAGQVGLALMGALGSFARVTGFDIDTLDIGERGRGA